jgi:acyl-CoA thioester hydrolase
MVNTNAWDSGLKAEIPAITESTTVRVRYGETDAMGWVYYGNYYLYFETGRTELIRKVWRPYRELEDEGFRLPVVESGCRYFRGARYDDLLRILTRLTLPTRARVRFDYSIQRDGDTEVIAQGFTEHCFVTATGKPVAIPEALRNLVNR